MSLIKVKYKNSAYKRSFSCGNEPEYNTYIGHVVPRQSWLSEHEFFLTTGDMDAPVRILDKRDIIEGGSTGQIVGIMFQSWIASMS